MTKVVCCFCGLRSGGDWMEEGFLAAAVNGGRRHYACAKCRSAGLDVIRHAALTPAACKKEAAAALKAVEKPFGWAVTVLISDRIIKLEETSERKTFHYRGSRSKALSRAMMKPHAWKCVEIEPVSEEAWRRALGNPGGEMVL